MIKVFKNIFWQFGSVFFIILNGSIVYANENIFLKCITKTKETIVYLNSKEIDHKETGFQNFRKIEIFKINNKTNKFEKVIEKNKIYYTEIEILKDQNIEFNVNRLVSFPFYYLIDQRYHYKKLPSKKYFKEIIINRVHGEYYEIARISRYDRLEKKTYDFISTYLGDCKEIKRKF